MWRSRAAAAVFVALTGLALGPGASPPEALKVEPPHWWVGHSLNPVRVMVRGRHLTGARVTTHRIGVRIGATHTSPTGTYLFIDLAIDPRVPVGPVPLEITTASGVARAPFELRSPLSRTGRFQGFSEDDVIYLIMPDRFANGETSNDDPPQSRGLWDRRKRRFYHGGDLQGVIDRLAYLEDLGITAIWLNPVYDNANQVHPGRLLDGEPVTDYHGYGAVDFYAVDEHLGDVAKLRDLVEAAHRHGIKVIQDQVANHIGPSHVWAGDPPTPTWFNGTADRHLVARGRQMRLVIDPHATAGLRQATLEGWFANRLPDLNQRDAEVAQYLIQNSLWWIGTTGLDGIRQDTLPYVPRQFWREWMVALKREYPTLKVVGEVLDRSPSVVSFFQTGRTRFDGVDSGIDTVFDYPLFFALRRAFAQGQSLRDVVDFMSEDDLYPASGTLVTLIGSHDVPRFMNEPGASVAGLKLAATFLFTARGTPQWYYGDEIAMPGGGDPDNRRDFPGGWPGEPRNAFEPSGRTADEQAAFAHVRALMRLRREIEPLRRGRMLHLVTDESAYVFARVTERSSVVVALNNAGEPATIACDVGPTGLPDGALMRDRLGIAGDVRVRDRRIEIHLPARSQAVYTAAERGEEPR